MEEKSVKGMEEEIGRKNELLAKALGKIELLQSRLEVKEKECGQFREKCKTLEDFTAKLKSDQLQKIGSIKLYITYLLDIENVISRVTANKLNWILATTKEGKLSWLQPAEIQNYKETNSAEFISVDNYYQISTKINNRL